MLSSQTLRIVFRKMLTGQRNTAPLDWLHPSLVAPGNGLKGTMCPAGWEIIWLSWTLGRVSVRSVCSGQGWFWLMISRGRELICVWPIKQRPRAHRHWWHTRVSLPSVCHWCELDTGDQRRCVRAGEIFTRCQQIISDVSYTLLFDKREAELKTLALSLCSVWCVEFISHHRV